MPSPSAGRKARSFHHSLYPASGSRPSARAERVGLPAGARVRGDGGADRAARCSRCASAGAIDEIVVVDAASADGTADGRRGRRGGGLAGGRADAALRAGARQGRRDVAGAVGARGRAGLLPGRRHARASPRTSPLACSGRWCASRGVASSRPSTAGPSSRAAFRWPRAADASTTWLARPALELFYPELAGVRQPLAGEVAARRELLGRAAVRHRLRRRDRDADRRLARGRPATGSPRSISTSIATATSRWSALEPMACHGAGDDRAAAASGKGACMARDSDGGPVERPPLAGVRCRVSARCALPRPRRHAARAAARRCCTTARGGCRSRGCARCRRACARAWRSC